MEEKNPTVTQVAANAAAAQAAEAAPNLAAAQASADAAATQAAQTAQATAGSPAAAEATQEPTAAQGSAGPTQEKPAKGFRAFLKRKNIEITVQRYLINALGAMAQGLFASLLMGTILCTVGTQCDIPLLNTIGQFAKDAAGPAMAIAIGFALQAPSLVLFSLAAVGIAANALGGAGGPLAVLVVAIIAAEAGKLVSGETKIDILVTPFVTIFVGCGLSVLIAPSLGAAATWVGNLIMWATELRPLLMGILVSVLVGIALTLPISSAAICAAFGLTGLAGGAAVAGCCAQMVGFATMSFKENRWGGLISQGLGTSMLQMGNIIRNPRIWIPPILASAITGPIATCVFKMHMDGAAISSGMGTCGLVGPIGVYTGWLADINAGTMSAITGFDWLGLLLICIILPALLTWIFGMILRKIGWIREGDLRLASADEMVGNAKAAEKACEDTAETPVDGRKATA